MPTMTQRHFVRKITIIGNKLITRTKTITAKNINKNDTKVNINRKETEPSVMASDFSNIRSGFAAKIPDNLLVIRQHRPTFEMTNLTEKGQ